MKSQRDDPDVHEMVLTSEMILALNGGDVAAMFDSITRFQQMRREFDALIAQGVHRAMANRIMCVRHKL